MRDSLGATLMNDNLVYRPALDFLFKPNDKEAGKDIR